jgi:hypothetical protein
MYVKHTNGWLLAGWLPFVTTQAGVAGVGAGAPALELPPTAVAAARQGDLQMVLVAILHAAPRGLSAQVSLARAIPERQASFLVLCCDFKHTQQLLTCFPGSLCAGLRWVGEGLA